MYAVILSGGKQYRVSEGDLLKVEKIEAEAGSTISLDKVLLVSDGGEVKVGTPYLDGAKVEATVEEHGKGEKISIIRFKRRKKYRRTLGHRQLYTALRIKSIS